jgi:hypothetical protein
MALISSNLLLEMMIIFIYPIINLPVELRGRFKSPIMPDVRGRVYEQCPNEKQCSGDVFTPDKPRGKPTEGGSFR